MAKLMYKCYSLNSTLYITNKKQLHMVNYFGVEHHVYFTIKKNSVIRVVWFNLH